MLYSLRLCDDLYLAQHILWQGLDGYTRASRFAGEILSIDGIEGRKVIHIRQEAHRLDSFLQ